MLQQFKKAKTTTPDKTCDEIIEGLFLGSVEALKQVMQGNPLQFDYVISVLDSDQIGRYYDAALMAQSKVQAHLYQASDHRSNCSGQALEKESANELKACFEPSSEIIQKALSEGKKVLVHCHSGVNRSASLVLHYLLTQKGLNWREANQAIVPKRGLQLTKSNRENLIEISKSISCDTQKSEKSQKLKK